MRHPKKQSGQTLLETLLSITLLSLVMAVVSSAVLFATQATGDRGQPSGSAITELQVVGLISEDLSLARYITEQEARAVTVVVADRTGDGQPDRLRYAWSGTRGDPLTFELNGSPQGHVLDSIAQFSLQYNTTASTTVLTERSVASGAQQQAYFTAPGLTAQSVEEKIDDKKRAGQLLSPTLSGGHDYFQVSSLRIRARSSGDSDGVITAELRLAESDGTPGATVLGSTTLLESSMSTAFKWHDLDFSASTAVAAGTQVCLVLSKASGDDDACEIEYDKESSYADGSFCYLYASDVDKPWQVKTGESMLIQVKVTPAELEPDHQVKRQHLTSIDLAVQSTVEERQPIQKQIRLIQAPLQLEAYWEAYYETDPKQITIDGDGVLGFEASSTAGPTGPLENDPWTVVKPLADASTQPSEDVITVEARLRSLTGDGPMILLPVTYDRTGWILPVWVKVDKDSAGVLKLAIYSEWVPIIPNYTIEIPSADWVDLDLTVLPDEELMMVRINGERKGVYALNRRFNLGYTGACELYDLDDHVGYAHVRIAVGGTYSSAFD